LSKQPVALLIESVSPIESVENSENITQVTGKTNEQLESSEQPSKVLESDDLFSEKPNQINSNNS
jgi:hypothetical protein